LTNTALAQIDSIDVVLDSTIVDSAMVSIDTLREDVVDVSYSKDSLDAPIDYTAKDSMIYDFTNELVHLYGSASVKYEDISLAADYIILNWATNTVTAEGSRDSLGKLQNIPEFSDAGQAFKANKMRYNFETQKGIIYDATSFTTLCLSSFALCVLAVFAGLFKQKFNSP